MQDSADAGDSKCFVKEIRQWANKWMGEWENALKVYEVQIWVYKQISESVTEQSC